MLNTIYQKYAMSNKLTTVNENMFKNKTTSA